jgi:hypothetical protein
MRRPPAGGAARPEHRAGPRTTGTAEDRSRSPSVLQHVTRVREHETAQQRPMRADPAQRALSQTRTFAAGRMRENQFNVKLIAERSSGRSVRKRMTPGGGCLGTAGGLHLHPVRPPGEEGTHRGGGDAGEGGKRRVGRRCPFRPAAATGRRSQSLLRLVAATVGRRWPVVVTGRAVTQSPEHWIPDRLRVRDDRGGEERDKKERPQAHTPISPSLHPSTDPSVHRPVFVSPDEVV